MNNEESYAADPQAIEEYLSGLLTADKPYARLYESMRYSVLSGGKRIRASKIGNTMIDIARENRGQTDATQRTLLAESYFGLKLAQEVERVRQET